VVAQVQVLVELQAETLADQAGVEAVTGYKGLVVLEHPVKEIMVALAGLLMSPGAAVAVPHKPGRVQQHQIMVELVEMVAPHLTEISMLEAVVVAHVPHPLREELVEMAVAAEEQVLPEDRLLALLIQEAVEVVEVVQAGLILALLAVLESLLFVTQIQIQQHHQLLDLPQ